ncbi:uncharacterized protein METZ01_LOCUS470418, partial [marine metagenome]
MYGGRERIRTSTMLPSLGPEPSASASSATRPREPRSYLAEEIYLPFVEKMFSLFWIGLWGRFSCKDHPTDVCNPFSI